jgi:cytochrome P450
LENSELSKICSVSYVDIDCALLVSSFIPEGNTIFLHTYTLHRDSRYFSPYTNDFWPDRWLNPGARKSFIDPAMALDPSVTVNMNLEAFIPFSLGPRNCIGKSVALNEMRVVVSYFVQKFNMKIAPGYNLDEWEQNLEDWFVLKKGRLPVILTERR